MTKQSAGLVVHRKRHGDVEVFLVHPGGPFWKNKDAGAWSIPKGEFAESEDPLEVARREFREETGQSIDGSFGPLQPIKQRGGKTVYAWAVESDFDASQLTSNTFTIEWPRGSGKFKEFPEVDRAEWFTLDAAMQKINVGQRELLEQLLRYQEK
ncbi:MAG TPA: NUDIX domain-containing protein [Lacipirellulaceae bacterium]|nr:NUDIX domain-containing protein [Lacipirellulaceae bacterium]